MRGGHNRPWTSAAPEELRVQILNPLDLKFHVREPALAIPSLQTRTQRRRFAVEIGTQVVPI